MRRLLAAFCLALSACTTTPAPSAAPPPAAEGLYRLDYSGVYGTGRVDLNLHDGKVGGLNPAGGAASYRGTYRAGGMPDEILVDLIVHLPPSRQVVAGVAIVGTAQDLPIRFSFPAHLGSNARWPIRIETVYGPISGQLARLP